ncbi:MAG: proton-conducting transporter membrane subunit, partial [Victivallaceae bacterium]|nr:proton-conducting transporter membrane subunit [Victivallaceae bacterium]
MMVLVGGAAKFGLLWVAVEATTLASAPLILYHRSAHSLEAMWKYLLICSVGIGLALFGTMLAAVACPNFTHLTFADFRAGTESISPLWFKFAFLFVLAGYGTKMGLAPFHTWLPDAHSEAPGTVSALLSGALLNCSFLGILRFYNIVPAEIKAFASQLLLALGLASLVIAGCFIVRQFDFKRMLAYSSVEHMGLLALMVSFGVAPEWIGCHIWGHSLIKMALFLTAGDLLLAYGTRSIASVYGGLSSMPKHAVLWMAGILFICGAPPSPLFLTELVLVNRAGFVFGAIVLVLLLVIFCAMTHIMLRMVAGEPDPESGRSGAMAAAEKLWTVPGIALLAAFFLGVCAMNLLLAGGLR